jgi:phage-related tail fiber protein
MSSEYFGLSPDGFQKPIYAANNFSDVVDKPTARTNLGAASSDDVLKAANPIGTIIAYYGPTAPYGYLPCSGQSVSSATFPSLVTFLGGTTSATLPDLRGEFLRGWDNGRGVDTGRAIGTAQSATIVTGQGQANGIPVTPANFFTESLSLWGAEPLPSLPAGFDIVAGASSGSSVITPVVGNLGYTRPRNISVLYCIKAYDCPVSAGILNVATLASQVPTLVSEMPLKLALADFTGTNQNITANGYQKLPGGLIIQWGNANTASSGGATTVTFPIIFPNACLQHYATELTNGAPALATTSVAGVGAATTTNFTVVTWSASTMTQSADAVHWLAIGY